MENCWEELEEELLVKIHLGLGRQWLCVYSDVAGRYVAVLQVGGEGEEVN